MSNPNENTAIILPGENGLAVIPPTALEAITRGEVDCQIATAHRYPRSMAQFKKRAIEMATIDQETAESCIYNRPVGGGKFAEGLSVRMAEIIGASYGNLRVGSMIVEQTDRYVICRGFAHDLESNFASTSEVKEPTVTKEGRPYSEGQRAVVAKAALSKARRDATFQVVPKALCRPIEKAARELIAGDAKSHTERVAGWVAWLQRLKIDLNRVWRALDIKGEGDITLDHCMLLAGIRNAIKDGDTTIDEAFPDIMPQGKVGAAKGSSVTEQAQTEQKEKAAGKPPTEEKQPEQPKGPTAAEILATIIAEGGKIDAGKAKIEKACVVLRYLEPADKLTEKLGLEKLAAILDNWQEVKDGIMNPEGQQ